MIQVILNKVEQKGKLYTITLGNGCFYEFKQLRKAKAFNCETSRFLTKKILLLNAIYIDLLTIGRKQWAISENRQGKGQNNFATYKKVCDSLNLVSNWFEYLVSYRCNSGVYAFICVEKITREFEQLFDIYCEAFGSYPIHSFAIDVEKNKYINRQIIKEIREYGLNDCTKVIQLLVSDFENQLKETFLNVG